jgi:hypothetical protein
LICIGDYRVKCLGPDHMVFKHLGRYFQYDFKDDLVRKTVAEKLEKLLKVVHKSVLSGAQKTWIADRLVVPKILWDMMIQSFPQSEVKGWQGMLTRFYKKWMGLALSAEPTILFRTSENQGYGLKSLLDSNVKQQVVKWSLLKESRDPQARQLFERRLRLDEKGEVGTGKVDSICLKIKELESVVIFEEMRGEIRKTGSKEGLKSSKKMSRRAKLLEVLKRDQEEKRIVPLHAFQMQANWLRWSPVLDRGMERSTDWGKVMTHYSERLFKFVMNAGLNTLPSPDNLKRWGVRKGKDFKCGLCSKSNVTAAHILAGCSYVLKTENQSPGTDRYTWRHNSVLSVIRKHLVKKVKEINGMEKKKASGLYLKKVFVKEGESVKKGKTDTPVPQKAKTLEKASDWKIDFDLSSERKRSYEMDRRVCSTSLIPDGFIVSYAEKICVVLELTCPMEENMDKWHKKKFEKYEEEIVSDVYQIVYVIMEVGARGGLPKDLRRNMRRLGLTKKEAKDVVEACVLMVRRCSFIIWCQRFNSEFVATEMTL